MACLCLAQGPLHAEVSDLPLEQLMQLQVTTASRYAQSALEAPAVVSVVTAEDIRLFGYRTLADVLASMRGLYVSYDRASHYLGTRGFATPGDYNTRVLLLVNGIRFNDSLYDQASIGTDFPIDIDLVERVEFVSGAGSAVYGPNAFFGVINVITRDGAHLRGPRVSAEAASHGGRKLRFSAGTVTEEGANWLISATRSTSRGADLYFPAFDTPSQNSGIARGLDSDRSTQLFASLRNGGLSVYFAHGEREKGVPTGAFSQVFNDPRSRVNDTSTRLGAEYAYPIRSDLSFVGRAHVGRYEYVGDYVYDYPPLTVNRDIGRAQWVGTELQWISTALARHKLSWGVDYRRDIRVSQQNLDLSPAVTYLDTRRHDDVIGLYVQDEFALAPDLTAHAGLRWGRQSGSEGNLHPRLGLVYWLQPSTALKLLHGTAFRPPNAYERDYRVDAPGGLVDTQKIRSERIRTTEIALEHAADGAQRILVNAFLSEVRDLIALADAPTPERLTLDNARGVKVHGAEVEYERRGHGDARLRLVYGWQKARGTTSGEALVNSPRHLFKAQWSDRLVAAPAAGWDPGRYAVELIGVGTRTTRLRDRLPPYVLANLTYSTRLGNTDVSLGLHNLFNRRYSDPASYEVRDDTIPQDGRTYRIKLTYAF